ncbi:hypothetical protein XA68_15550 [Ophiocordyceps unilateralis]|uniref:Uncharacterized protein n=1 Tax=Ophiocordyceps unilateralis TaxID=268505 RepID=A0A2A9PKW3_OPHUN|nr:hypothetical protein XA68_15550 [Ophiocordyceps unilateralis]
MQTLIDLTGDDESALESKAIAVPRDGSPPAKRRRSDAAAFRSFKLQVVERRRVVVGPGPCRVGDEARGRPLVVDEAEAEAGSFDVQPKSGPNAHVIEQARAVKPQAAPQVVKGLASKRCPDGPTRFLQPRRSGAQPAANKWFRLEELPYLPAADRDLIVEGSRQPIPRVSDVPKWPLVYHVDFTADEVDQILTHLSELLLEELPKTIRCLTALCFRHHVPSLVGHVLPRRRAQDVHNFCADLMAGRAADPRHARTLSLDRPVKGGRQRERQCGRISSLLLAREMEGNAGFGRMRQYANLQNDFTKTREDLLAVVAEFTNCAGDISTMSWVSDGNVLCGTTAHSDAHNQQYNKPGNLVLGSTQRGTLQAMAHHRIPRPRVEKGDNASEAMRQSQDPWLYCSVVSSDYDAVRRRAYTSSFDWTVKVWQVEDDGSTMACVATWHHGGNVNFVEAAPDGSGRVASAADVPSQAVRVYSVRDDDVDGSPYQAISCTRADADGCDSWAYFPATMQWGRAPGTTQLLMVGYSPRGRTEDHDIPEDKRNTGEIMLWDAARGHRVPVLTATTANVFEVAWHPTMRRFIVATSPSGLPTEKKGIRTQIRIFQEDRDRLDGAYSEFQKLDCVAADINELTFMPNSLHHAYITAGCTDGHVYVWDTAQGDDPIHVLRHGYPLDEFSYDREKEDTGVKFTAWGASPDRLYTGSSDGVVKVWNVRNRGDPFVRDLLEAPGPISVGAFSPDHARLAVGDATGRVFLLSVDERDEHPAHLMAAPGCPNRRVRRPRPFTPHPEPEPPPPAADDEGESRSWSTTIASYARNTYLDTKQLTLHANPVIGAVQGPSYASTALFRREAHLDEDPFAPLLTEYERLQRDACRGRAVRPLRRLRDPLASEGEAADDDGEGAARRGDQHAANTRLDVEGLKLLASDVWDCLCREGAVLSDVTGEDWGFVYEEGPATPPEEGTRV